MTSELILGSTGGGDKQGDFTVSNDTVSVYCGFRPTKIYVYKDMPSSSASSNWQNYGCAYFYDKNNLGDYQYRAYTVLSGTTRVNYLNIVACPNTTNQDCIKEITDDGFTFNADAYYGGHFYFIASAI